MDRNYGFKAVDEEDWWRWWLWLTVLTQYPTSNPLKSSPFWEANNFSASREIPCFLWNRSSLPCLQKPTTCPNSQPDKSRRHSPILLFEINFNCVFLSIYNKICYIYNRYRPVVKCTDIYLQSASSNYRSERPHLLMSLLSAIIRRHG